MKGKRPSLAGTVKRAIEAPTERPSGRAGKRGLTVFVEPEMHRRLKYMAVDLDCSIEAIVVSALSEKLVIHEKTQSQREPARNTGSR